MAYEKLQIELYANQGGMNEKASDYIVGDSFFLNLRNYGFERPGALVSRPGIMDSASLAGTSFINVPRMLSNYEYTIAGLGGSQIVFDTGNKLFALSSPPVLMGTSLTANLTTSFPIDYTVAKNRLYIANGQAFGHQGISNYTFYSLPGGTLPQGSSGLSLAVQAGPGQTFILPSGTYAATWAYARYIQGTSLYEVGSRYNGPSFLFFNLGATQVGKNPLFSAKRFPIADSQRFGVSAVGIWIAPPGATFEFINVFEDSAADTFLSVSDQSYATPRADEPDTIPFFTLQPRFLEQYKNMLMMAGFSGSPSTIWHSELGDAENIQPENFIEIRTDNGDQITCLKTFQNTVIIFKNSSIHELNGDSPETFSVKDMTLEYGCVNNDAAVVFENKLWFVDKRGICEYSGSNTFIVSDAVDTTFKTLDLTKAKAFHIKKRTEVWFCFGGTTLVFDYSVKGWTIYDGIDVQSGVGSGLIEYGVSTMDLTFWKAGASFHSLSRFQDSLTTDRGNAITLIKKTPYFKRMGDSTQEMFRRFYLDADVPGTTTGCTIRLMPDYGSSVYSAYGFYLDSFQKKVEFGISARSLAIESVIKASSRITINGYALHARFLRSV